MSTEDLTNQYVTESDGNFPVLWIHQQSVSNFVQLQIRLSVSNQKGRYGKRNKARKDSYNAFYFFAVQIQDILYILVNLSYLLIYIHICIAVLQHIPKEVGQVKPLQLCSVVSCCQLLFSPIPPETRRCSAVQQILPALCRAATSNSCSVPFRTLASPLVSQLLHSNSPWDE